jgi:ubiquinone/menaquinone biosynthesis C-methylase UbiE
MSAKFTKPSGIATEKEVQASYDALHRQGSLRESRSHYRWVLKVLAPEKGKKLLDVACGGGYFLREAEKTGVESCGVDISTVAAKQARQSAPRSAVLCGNGEFLPFGGEVFDYTVNLGSLEHFTNPEKGVREMARVLKKEGKALLLLPNSYFLMTILNVWRTGATGRETAQAVDRWATRDEWVRLVEENGLKVNRVLKYNYRAREAPFKYKLARPFIPLHLSYCFLFVCRKAWT